MSSERERLGGVSLGPDSFSDDFASTATVSEGHVEVIHGVYAHSLPLAGMSVGDARNDLQARMNIDPDAVAVVDGVEVEDDSILQERQVLNFVRRAGEKG